MTTIANPSASFAADIIDNGKASGQQILVIGLCLFLNMLDGFDITAMSIVNTAVGAELDLTPDRLGLISSAALFGMACGAMFIAPLSDIFGRRNVIIGSVFMVSVSIMLTANANSLTAFILLRMLSGLGAGAMLASQAALAIEYSPEKYKALSVALVTSGYPLGAMMTAVIGGFIMPEYGWRGMFWFGGGLTLFMCAVTWVLLPESLQFLVNRRPKDALEKINRTLQKLGSTIISELPDIGNSQDKGNSASAIDNFQDLFREEYRNKTIIIWTSFLLCFSTMYFLMTWIPALMEYSGFTAATGRTAFFLFNLGGVIGIWLLGAISTKAKLSNIVSSFLLSSAFLLIVFASSPNQETLLLSLVLAIGILFQGGFTGLYAIAAKVYPVSFRSTGVGWAIGLGRAGAVIGPGAAGFLIAAGFDMSANFYIFSVPVILGGIIAYSIHVR
ncbi:MAG: MFS transporter [Gammaproteobacteria bacterium]|jgi:MFS transporter, AAHS family, 4-hydroxybenzoate transporter|nr:MFS transporter [Gammaproteobacteria bacterium]